MRSASVAVAAGIGAAIVGAVLVAIVYSADSEFKRCARYGTDLLPEPVATPVATISGWST